MHRLSTRQLSSQPRPTALQLAGKETPRRQSTTFARTAAAGRAPYKMVASEALVVKEPTESTEQQGQEIDEPLGEGFIRVGAKSNPRAVAGKIAHSSRDGGEPPATMCIGAASINQAVKAIAIARQYLTKDEVELSFQPAFRSEKRRASVALYIAKSAPGSALDGKDPAVEFAELTVKGTSKPAILAGALAARVREGKWPTLTAIGVDAVSNAVLAIGNCRLYLEQDQKDVRAYPEFITIQKEDRELNAIKFVIRVEAVEAVPEGEEGAETAADEPAAVTEA